MSLVHTKEVPETALSNSEASSESSENNSMAASKDPQPSNNQAGSKIDDLEIKDAQLIFQNVWAELEESVGGVQNMVFPKEIFWLNGAPGAGKGTNTQFIIQRRDFTDKPVVVSSLLSSPEAQKLIDAGMMVGDNEVTKLVFQRLLDPAYENGAVVDGYPRTKVQVECLKLFYNKLNDLRAQSVHYANGQRFRKPRFHIIVLYIDEAESVERQLSRGRKALEHNKEVERTGFGEQSETRTTDLDEEAARNRYRTFKEKTYESLKSLREIFHYHLINARGPLAEVQERILQELQYQSSLELSQETHDRLSSIPIASTIAQHARQQLVERLEYYEENHTELFQQVASIIEIKFMPIIPRHAISGMALVSTEAVIFSNPLALAMLIDIFSERGYTAVVDIRRREVPVSFDTDSGKITTRSKKLYRVQVKFPGSDIRRGR